MDCPYIVEAPSCTDQGKGSIGLSTEEKQSGIPFIRVSLFLRLCINIVLSGAPKIRACQIIEELEKEERGIYGGALGYLDFTGNMDTCIAIRMAVKKDQKVYVQAGGGIVADSVPEKEYEESANKAAAVIQAIIQAEEEGI